MLPTKQTPSLNGLIAWLETQNHNETYRYMSTRDCLVARYLKAIGIEPLGVDDAGYYNDGFPSRVKLPRTLGKVAFAGMAVSTYGEALERAYTLRDRDATA